MGESSGRRGFRVQEEERRSTLGEGMCLKSWKCFYVHVRSIFLISFIAFCPAL
jgi:hypothetical protein